jgi:hypothetical protein
VKNSLQPSLIRSSNIVNPLFRISRKTKMHSGAGSRVGTRYRKLVGGCNIASHFYSNESPNDDLESEFKKDSWRCS